MTPEHCIDTYNRLTGRLCTGRQRPASYSQNMIGAARRYIEWCAGRGIDPRHWMIARHEATGWTHRIALSKLSTATDKFADDYHDWGANKLAGMDQERRDRRSVVGDTNRVVEVTLLGEAQKAAYRDEPELCLLFGEAITGGWHPASKWCAECSAAPECRDRLAPAVRQRRGDDARSR